MTAHSAHARTHRARSAHGTPAMVGLAAFGLVLVGLCHAGCARTPEKSSDVTSSGPSAHVLASKPEAPAPLPVSSPARDVGASEAGMAPGIADQELKVEEKEADPYSETVALKLTVSPPVRATVMWGAKQLARLGPGQGEAEIVRPRGSGPLDLEIKADGYLPHHTRLYADRNDKVSVRLYRPEDAAGLLGYKRPPNASDKSK